MNTKNIISGLQVMAEINGEHKYGVVAEHDQIFINLDIPPRSHHIRKLQEAGWSQVETNNDLWWYVGV